MDDSALALVAPMILFTACFFGFTYLFFGVLSDESRLRTVWKTSGLTLLAAFVLLVGGSGVLVLALLFSAAGDAFLARKGNGRFLAGLFSFLLAHVLYVFVFVSLGDDGPKSLGTVLAVVLSVGALFYLFLYRNLGAMKLPVLAYVVIIGLMAATAIVTHNMMLITGAMLFLTSDTVLALQLFRMQDSSPRQRLSSLYVWFAYFTGQLLIVLAIMV